ncbi:B-cell receptor CD22-like [Leptodactylus fuscus]|uniref:B-cell receptor CD22-like n=1 Tax=Leptodactylus fuscus TaxID=238119 RepID=UPI003F4EC9AE
MAQPKIAEYEWFVYLLWASNYYISSNLSRVMVGEQQNPETFENFGTTPDGSTVRPVVTFTPPWYKILYEDSITMTCDVAGAVQGDVTYTWYRNNQWIQQGKTFTIQSAQSIHDGNYQCGTSEEDISEEVTLYVMHGPVVLQSPPYIYEGDDLALRCHSRYKDIRGTIYFYKNNEIIHSSTTDSEFLYRDHLDVTAVYKCRRQVITTGYTTYSDETEVTAPGSSDSVMVTFSPNWKKIFTGDSITMTCDVIIYGTYSWYKDNKPWMKIDQKSMYIYSAQSCDSGKYQCRTSSGSSPEVSLEVSDGPVILQAPLIYDGSIPYLRCRSRPEYPVGWTRFYKDGEFLQDSEDGYLYLTKPVVTGRYKCEKVLYWTSVLDGESAPSSVPIRDLFSRPEIRLTPSNVTEGDNMALTCDTRLSPPRQTTELQFAFYRDGREVRGFLSSNKYILSAKLEDSGNYSCAGRTGDNRVRKTSQDLSVQIHSEYIVDTHGLETYLYPTVSVILLLLIIISAFLIFRHRHHLCRLFPKRLRTRDPEPGMEFV